jgi:hypothetical protein
MAISDYEPHEAAAIVLDYRRVKRRANRANLHNMLIDKVCEEYPNSHASANVPLLFKAYNGKFPNAKASVVYFSMTPIDGKKELTENVLKLLNNGLSDRNLIKRLFDDQMTKYSVSQCGSDYLELNTTDNVNFNLVTSENWINMILFPLNLKRYWKKSMKRIKLKLVVLLGKLNSYYAKIR